jgi:hypothetical protein
MGARILAFCAFHNDADAQDQMIALLLNEAGRQEVLGPKGYKPSGFAKVIEHAVIKGVPARSIAGLVTLAFVHAASRGNSELTRYGATQMVERLVSVSRGRDRRPLTLYGDADGTMPERKLPVASGRQDIERRFIAYHAIGPLMAAQFVQGFNRPAATFAESVRGDCTHLLNAAWQVETTVCRVFPRYFPKLVRLHPQLSSVIARVGGWDIHDCADELFGR